jgi:hypothetical protein
VHCVGQQHQFFNKDRRLLQLRALDRAGNQRKIDLVVQYLLYLVSSSRSTCGYLR